MIELPDDELDKLFRKSSEELDPQFDPEDWNSLKKRLDRHDGKTAGGWLRKWWSLGALALLIPIGFAAYYMTKRTVSQNEKTKQNVAAIKGLQSQEPAAPPVSSKEEQVQEPATSPVSSKEEKVQKPAAPPVSGEEGQAQEPAASPVSSNNNITDYQRRKILPRSQSKTGGVYLEPNRSKQEGGDGAFSNNSGQVRDQPAVASDVKPFSEQTLAQNSEQRLQQKEHTAEAETRMLISAGLLSSRPLNWKNQPESPVVAYDAPEVEPESVKPEKPVEDYAKWAVRLGYSPDLSTVGFKNFTRPGAAFSLLVEYGLSPRIYLQTGVVRSVKEYSANANEYKLYDYVTKINTPYAVDGQCTMLEIPLGLRFNVMQREQSKLFVGAGVSSYYAQKEQYKYHYAKYVHYQKEGWKGKTGWFLLSHINASVGYERSITQKLSLVAEPYIRIPVKGVGYGKVNLTTVGMWISLRYTPAFK
ncbi:hypothetical protein [Dyadobacter sp. CY326]|uniref:hypothetical protein n=1 Tax=Dyadobacter sp. CY326 TaxID=2907300 RepID=UPI001F2A8AD1|nr:hypothetical protein [Dyadobacter sp. CY326]MCE7067316.1 hypothetical protein [Dyadobacter sp. CY326]